MFVCLFDCAAQPLTSAIVPGFFTFHKSFLHPSGASTCKTNSSQYLGPRSTPRRIQVTEIDPAIGIFFIYNLKFKVEDGV